MSTINKPLASTIALSLLGGCLPTALIAGSDDGYAVAVYIVLLLLIALIVLLLVIAGIICLAGGKKVGKWLLLAALILPVSFIGSAFIAKQLELGAYYQEPVRSIPVER